VTAPLDLGAIEELEKAATPGPWGDASNGYGGEVWSGAVEKEPGYVRGLDRGTCELLSVHPNELDEDEEGAVEQSETNAAFIVALRNAAPQLLAAARELAELKSALLWQMRNGLQGKYGDPAGTVELADEQILAVWFSGLSKLGWTPGDK
jgi:hypothetical protein